MSETVVSRITSRGGDFLLDAAEPGQMVQINNLNILLSLKIQIRQ